MKPLDPFSDLERALRGDEPIEEVDGVRIDTTRLDRTGVPEVVYAPGKSTEQVQGATYRLLNATGRAMVARATRAQIDRLVEMARSDSYVIDAAADVGIARLWTTESTLRLTGGRVGILTAGTSDRMPVGEAAELLKEMGCDVRIERDVGVAGLHRLVGALRSIVAFDPDALIVAAGMDGVLPSVVSGLVSLPIVALPTSTGYGFGGEGVGAMTTMLQTCAPGIAVVNIDNGIGAGAMAGLIANRAAAQRAATPPPAK